MKQVKESTTSDFSTEHRKYMQGISAFVTILAIIYISIMFYFNAYGALLINGLGQTLGTTVTPQ